MLHSTDHLMKVLSYRNVLNLNTQYLTGDYYNSGKSGDSLDLLVPRLRPFMSHTIRLETKLLYPTFCILLYLLYPTFCIVLSKRFKNYCHIVNCVPLSCFLCKLSYDSSVTVVFPQFGLFGSHDPI